MRGRPEDTWRRDLRADVGRLGGAREGDGANGRELQRAPVNGRYSGKEASNEPRKAFKNGNTDANILTSKARGVKGTDKKETRPLFP